jgi:hypothetical protein
MVGKNPQYVEETHFELKFVSILLQSRLNDLTVCSLGPAVLALE